MPPLLTRRAALKAALGTLAASTTLAPFERLAAQVRFDDYPFQLGVASGDPTTDGFVLWTRLAPEPAITTELGDLVFEVDWEIATDRQFTAIVKRGRSLARPSLAHAVHVEVSGLDAGREYFYRFSIAGEVSPVGRALTAPGGAADRVRFGITSCAHYEQGYFAGYRYLADDQPDLVLALGDYIYESSWGDRRVRLFRNLEAETLDDYRRRYAEYRLDPDLQAAHAACPWLVTWDDHEVDNDYVTDVSEDELCAGAGMREAFRERRRAAYQAWFEHMPIRPSRLRAEGGIQVYGACDWGALARFYVLDTRQYRTPIPCGKPTTFQGCDFPAHRKRLFGAGGGSFVDPTEAACKRELENPAQSALGAAQEAWLDGELAASPARWNLLAQQVMFTPLVEGTQESPRIWTDAWSGYPLARDRLLASLAKHRVRNPVVLTGDIHCFWANEVPGKGGRPVAVELVTSSLAALPNDKRRILPLNPHVKFHDGQHPGYVLCDVTPSTLTARFYGLEDMRDPRTRRVELATFVVDDGSPALRNA